MKSNCQMNVIYRILYVDDDPNLLEIGQFFLEESGDFNVVTSNLATEALNIPGFRLFRCNHLRL